MDTSLPHGEIRPKLLLVDPYPRNNPYRMTASERRSIWFPKLSLPAIAAYTPTTWDVEIVDEVVMDINFETPCDVVVGVSNMTCYAPRAYEIADEFRRRGNQVILGGVDPTYCPDEALHHCDAIVCGEAEDLWPQVITDLEAGTLKRIYRMDQFPALSTYKPPRIELLSPDSYMTRLRTFTTRGCHFDCEFCSVSPCNGKTTRFRSVPEVIEELKQAKEWLRSDIIERMTRGSLFHALTTSLKISVGLEEGSIVAFVDDLHDSHRVYYRDLWQSMKSLNIKWGCHSTLFFGNDPEMVKLAAESGCVSVFVGMESLSDDSLDETNKGFNQVRKFENQIEIFHDHGIMVNPGLVFGFDNDDESVFETAVEFLTRNKVELAYFNVLIPLPGTAPFERFKQEDRIFDQDWSKYARKHVTYTPKRMTAEQLQEGFFWANHQFHSLPCIWNRMGHMNQRLIPRLEMNWEFRKLTYRATPKGSLSPLAKILKTLQVKLLTSETQQIIANVLHPQPSPDSNPQELCLRIKARRHDAFAALVINLEGTLDHLNAKELLKRIQQAGRAVKMDIVVNFENLKQETPKAIYTLLDGKTLQAILPHTKLRYRNLIEAFQSIVSEIALDHLNLFNEDIQHA